MDKQRRFVTHRAYLSALFILGNAVIVYPQSNADKFTVLAFLCVFVFLCILFPLLFSFIIKIFSKQSFDGFFIKVLYIVIFSATAVYSLFCAADSFKMFTRFATNVILYDTQHFFVALIFAITVIFFCLRSQENLLKFSLISFCAVALFILFFFFSAMSGYDFQNIFIFRLPELSEIITQAKPYIINPFASSFLLAVYSAYCFKKQSCGAVFCGVVLGNILLLLCVLCSVLLFGTQLAGRLEFPFSSAISTVTIGRLFTRLDGFSYYIYFICALIRITVLMFITISSLKKLDSVLKWNPF